MKKHLISVLLSLFFFIGGTVPVLANGNPCEDATKQVQAFVSSLNSKIKAGAGQGLFEVKPIEQEGVVTRWSITYKLSGHAIFLQDVVTNPVMETLKVSANIFNGHSGLIFTYSFGATGAIGCGYAVFPQKEQFTALEIPYPFLIEDFDRDNNVELLILEPEQWGSDCVPARADIPHWPRIFRLETQSGQLVDISKQFPQVYVDEQKEYQARYEKLKKEKLLTSECSTRYSQFIERLRQSGLKINEDINLSGTWAGIAFFKGQKYPMQLSLRTINNKIEGESSETFQSREGPKTLHGKISGEINGTNVRMIKIWIDHPAGRVNDTEYNATIDRRTGKIKGTFKIENATGEWYMEKTEVGLTTRATSIDSPSELILAVWDAANKGLYSQVESLMSEESRSLLKNLGFLAGGIKGVWDKNTKSGTVTRVEIIRVETRGEGAKVFFNVYFRDGSMRENSDSVIKENGKWRLGL